MNIKMLKQKIEILEGRLNADRYLLAEKHTNLTHRIKHTEYLWFLLPIGGFILGLRKDFAIVAMMVSFLRIYLFSWGRQYLFALVPQLLRALH